MTRKSRIRLVDMKNGQIGFVVQISGGTGVLSKLEALGIRVGTKVVKKSALIARGPVIVGVAGTEIAMGYGMAAKIYVEVDADENTADR